MVEAAEENNVSYFKTTAPTLLQPSQQEKKDARSNKERQVVPVRHYPVLDLEPHLHAGSPEPGLLHRPAPRLP